MFMLHANREADVEHFRDVQAMFPGKRMHATTKLRTFVMHSVVCRIQYRNWQAARIQSTTPHAPTTTPVAPPAAIPIATVAPPTCSTGPIFFSEQDDSCDMSAYPTVPIHTLTAPATPSQYFIDRHAAILASTPAQSGDMDPALLAQTAAQFNVPHLEDFLGQEF